MNPDDEADAIDAYFTGDDDAARALHKSASTRGAGGVRFGRTSPAFTSERWVVWAIVIGLVILAFALLASWDSPEPALPDCPPDTVATFRCV